MKLFHNQAGISTAYALVIHAILVSSALVFLGIQIKNNSAPSQRTGVMLPSATPPTTQRGQVQAPSQAPAPFNQSKLNTSLKSDYVYGSKNATKTLFTFMDYECPYCTKFYPIAKQLVDQSNSKINFVIRFYPLDFHVHANALANAALCVGEQKGDKAYFTFADKVNSLSGQLKGDTETILKPIVTSLGIDNAKFNTCMKDNHFSKQIKASIEEGKAVGVSGTPSMVLYDSSTKKARFLVGIKDVSQLQAEFDQLSK